MPYIVMITYTILLTRNHVRVVKWHEQDYPQKIISYGGTVTFLDLSGECLEDPKLKEIK